MPKREKTKIMKVEAKRHLILEEIAKGTSYYELIQKFKNEWHLQETTVKAAIADALAFMRAESTKDDLIAANMQRLDSIISESMKDSDRRSAIKAIDVQNKLAGGYEEKIKLEGDSEINLVFDLGV